MGLLTAAALAISFLLSPDDLETGRVVLTPPCQFRALVGLPCPTCGLTRSFTAMSRAEVARASDFHWLGPVLYVVVWVGFLAGTRGTALALRDCFRQGGPP